MVQKSYYTIFQWNPRERHIMPSMDHTLAQLSNAKIFSKLNANSSFWQTELSKQSALLTTFITPFG